MNESQVLLSSDERDYLIRLLQSALREVRVEERHTDSPEYKSDVMKEENTIRGLLSKIQPLVT
jgi:hypothetical protein